MSAEWVLWAVVMVCGVPLVCALYTIGAILRIQRETMNDWTRDPVENARRIRDMHRTTQQADSATVEPIMVPVEPSVIPAGYEPVAFRVPSEGDTWLNIYDGRLSYVGGVDAPKLGPRLIVRPIWTPPAWLKPGWVAMDENGAWWWYAVEPTRGLSAWYGVGQCRLTPATNFNPPRCDDWINSKMQIGA